MAGLYCGLFGDCVSTGEPEVFDDLVEEHATNNSMDAIVKNILFIKAALMQNGICKNSAKKIILVEITFADATKENTKKIPFSLN